MPQSPQDTQEFTQVFHIFDRDKSGFISRKELSLCMSQCGFDVTKDETQRKLNGMDTDHDGKLSLDEFIALAASLEK